MDEPSDLTPADVVKTAVSSLVVKGQGIGRISKDVDPEGQDFILSRYGLVRDGRLTIAGALLFTAEPTRINRGAFLKIGLFDRDGVLKREDIIEIEGILKTGSKFRIYNSDGFNKCVNHICNFIKNSMKS